MHRLPDAIWRPRVATLIEQLALGDFLTQPVRELSLGQRMRGEVVAALVHAPELLVLDEPTIGLDVLSKNALREFLQAERTERGTTLFLTTHDLGDVQRLCDRMVIIDHGRRTFDGTASDLARVTGAERVLVADLAEPVGELDLPRGPAHRHRGRWTPHHDRLRARHRECRHPVRGRRRAGTGGRSDLTEPAIEDLVARIYRRGA